MRYVAFTLVALLYVSSSLGQTKPAQQTSGSAAGACQTIVKCRAELKKDSESMNTLADANRKLEADKSELSKENGELSEQVEGAKTVLRLLDKEMKLVPLTDDDKNALGAVHDADFINLGAAIENDQNEYVKVVQQLAGDNDSAVRRYNSLLADYKDYVNRVGIQLAAIGQANRVANALALYNALPKYQPPQTINIQLTNCTALPALCVH